MKPPPPMLPAVGMDDGERERGGDRGVDGRSTFLDHVGADARRNLVLRRDHALLRANRNRAGADRDRDDSGDDGDEQIAESWPWRGLYLCGFPCPAPEDERGDERHHRKRDGHRPERPIRSHAQRVRQEIREREFAEPAAADVDPGRRHGIAGAVERLGQHVAAGVERQSRR